MMSLDQQGYFWLSNPLIAAFTIVVAVGLLLWCHRSRPADGSGRPGTASVRARKTPPTRRRTSATGAGSSRPVGVERGRRDVSRRCVA
jgi:hypothetical protein